MDPAAIEDDVYKPIDVRLISSDALPNIPPGEKPQLFYHDFLESIGITNLDLNQGATFRAVSPDGRVFSAKSTEKSTSFIQEDGDDLGHHGFFISFSLYSQFPEGKWRFTFLQIGSDKILFDGTLDIQSPYFSLSDRPIIDPFGEHYAPTITRGGKLYVYWHDSQKIRSEMKFCLFFTNMRATGNGETIRLIPQYVGVLQSDGSGYASKTVEIPSSFPPGYYSLRADAYDLLSPNSRAYWLKVE